MQEWKGGKFGPICKKTAERLLETDGMTFVGASLIRVESWRLMDGMLMLILDDKVRAIELCKHLQHNSISDAQKLVGGFIASAKEIEDAEFNSVRWRISVGYRNRSPEEDSDEGSPSFNTTFHNIEVPGRSPVLPLSDHVQQQLEDLLEGIHGESDENE